MSAKHSAKSAAHLARGPFVPDYSGVHLFEPEKDKPGYALTRRVRRAFGLRRSAGPVRLFGGVEPIPPAWFVTLAPSTGDPHSTLSQDRDEDIRYRDALSPSQRAVLRVSGGRTR